MVGRHGEHQRLGLDDPQVQSLASHGRSQHTHVEATVGEPVDLGWGQQVGVDLQRESGQLALDDAGDPGELGVGPTPGEGDADEALATLRDAAYTSHTVVHSREYPCDLALQELAGRGEPHLACGPGEQRGAELGLQLADGLRECRLRHVEPLGRAAEVAGLRHGGEVAQVSQLHRSLLTLVSAVTAVAPSRARPEW